MKPNDAPERLILCSIARSEVPVIFKSDSLQDRKSRHNRKQHKPTRTHREVRFPENRFEVLGHGVHSRLYPCHRTPHVAECTRKPIDTGIIACSALSRLTVATSRSIITREVEPGSMVSKAWSRPRRATTFCTILSGMPLGCCTPVSITCPVHSPKGSRGDLCRPFDQSEYLVGFGQKLLRPLKRKIPCASETRLKSREVLPANHSSPTKTLREPDTPDSIVSSYPL